MIACIHIFNDKYADKNGRCSGGRLKMLKSIRKNCILVAMAATATMGIMSCSRQTATSIALPDQPGNHLGVQMQLNVRVPMRDGVSLAADVFTPDGPGPYPVVLTRTPYDKTGAQSSGVIGAQRGFIMVDMDVRGRYR